MDQVDEVRAWISCGKTLGRVDDKKETQEEANGCSEKGRFLHNQHSMLFKRNCQQYFKNGLFSRFSVSIRYSRPTLDGFSFPVFIHLSKVRSDFPKF